MTRPAVTQVETYENIGELPSDAAPLLASAPHFFATPAWWHIVLTDAIPAKTRPVLLLIRSNGIPAALFPMHLDPARNRLQALTTPYTCLYEPLIAPNRAPDAALFGVFARYCRSFAATRLDALDQAGTANIATAAEQAGLVVAKFNHFGNWHEPIAGQDWPAYLSRRPGALRATIQRRTQKAEQLPGAKMHLFHRQDDIESGIAAFETVYAKSWKPPEPFPTFNAAQIRAAAALGIGRLGVWSIDGTPAAAQFWIVEHQKGTVLKLAHDEAFRAHSPGTVLTAWMIRHLIERDSVQELDFGRGDDPYKQGWAASRRQRVGLMLINPRRPAGMLELARHAAGRAAARLRRTG